MEIKDYESKLMAELKPIIEDILGKNKKLANVASGGRPGAEISSFLEKKFVEFTNSHPFFKDSQSSKEAKTKNPWDARTKFVFQEYKQDIWLDFKSFKSSAKNSNPAIGATNKVIQYINDGQFYLIYIYVYYKQTKEGIEFEKIDKKNYSKIYFLKNVNSSFWRDPTGQMQVNFKKEPQYRSRQDFIELLNLKIEEGLNRQLINIQKKLGNLQKGIMFKKKQIEITKKDLLVKNKAEEDAIKNLK